MRRSVALYHEIGAASGESLARQQLGVVLTAKGALAEALDVLEEGVTVAERAVMRAHCQARLFATMARNRLAADDLAAADEALAWGLRTSRRHGNCATCDALLLPVAARVRLAQGRVPEAEQFCTALNRAALDYGSRTWIAMARQVQGRVAAAQGAHEDALRAFRKAIRGFRQAGFIYEVARCLRAKAQVLADRGDQEDEARAQRARREAQQILAGLLGEF